jgi:hypothetical protein
MCADGHHPHQKWHGYMEDTVDTMARIVYDVDSDQCDFELHMSSGSRIVDEMLRDMIGKE